jgi:hypothetical protein
MWFRSFLLAVLAVGEVAADSRAAARTFTEMDVVEVLRDNPNVLPKNSSSTDFQ